MPRTKTYDHLPTRVMPISPGRTPIYDPNTFPDMAYKFCLLGATNEQLGKFFGVKTNTIDYWMSTHVPFFKAVHEGRDIADAEVAKSLHNRATGFTKRAVKIFCNPTTGNSEIIEYDEYHPPDTRACQYWLNNRRRHDPGKWVNAERKEISGPDGAPVSFQDTTLRDKQAAEARARLAALAGLEEA